MLDGEGMGFIRNGRLLVVVYLRDLLLKFNIQTLLYLRLFSMLLDPLLSLKPLGLSTEDVSDDVLRRLSGIAGTLVRRIRIFKIIKLVA